MRTVFIAVLISFFFPVSLDAAALRGRVYLHPKPDLPEKNPYTRDLFRTDLRFTKWHMHRRFEHTRLRNYEDPQDTIIYFSRIPEAYRMKEIPTQEPVLMCIENARFEPRTLPIMTGTAVEFCNRDPVYHDVYSFSPAHAFQTPFFKSKKPVTTFKKAGGATLHSSIYEGMNAQILVLDHPWFTKPRDTGYYHLRNIRPGMYTATAWHPDFPPISKEIEINYSETITLDFHMSTVELPETIVKD